MESNVKKRSIKLGGHILPLAFTLHTLINVKKEFPDFDTDNMGRMASDPEKLVILLYYMTSDAAKLAGEKLDIDREWIAVNIPVNARKLIAIQLAVIHTVTDSMTMESEEDDETDREVDLVLQEIQKKREKTGSAGGKSSPGD